MPLDRSQNSLSIPQLTPVVPSGSVCVYAVRQKVFEPVRALVLVVLLGTVPVVWAQADPAKEVADSGLKRAQAAAKGDIEGFLADVADNVVVTASGAGSG